MNKKKLIKVATTLLLAMACGAIGFVAATMGISSAKTFPLSHFIALCILFFPAFFVVIGIHEAGHAVAGRLVNFDFRMYVVGPFMWDKEEAGWKFKWNRNVNLSGGMVVSLPTTTENLAKRFSIYALGGPTFSLLFALTALGIKYTIALTDSNGTGALHFLESLFGLLGFLSLIIFIFTALPFQAGGFYTDGARTIRFLRGGDTSRFELLLMKIFLSSSGGMRPRSLDVGELDEAMFLAKKLNAPMGVYLHAYYYQVALDLENFVDAENHLKNYIGEMESIPKGIQNAVWLDAAFFYAYARRDLPMAEQYWNKFKPSAILPKSQIYATEAALSILKNQKELALQKIEAALKQLPNMMDRGVGISLREKLLHMKSTMAS